MPASTLDPVNAALRTALKGGNVDNTLDSQIAGSTKKALLANIEFESAGSYQSNVLDKLKSKYIVLKANETNKLNKSKQDTIVNEESLPPAKHELYSQDAVQLGWTNSDWSVGAGMVNMGNTCYLNSTLQALFHVPALVNWIVADKQRTSDCEDAGGHCVICAMRKTLLDSQQRNISSIRPYLIFNKLRIMCRTLILGQQEDAHEFLKYLVDGMEKSYLLRFKNNALFDSRTKETTPLNQILGGYLRSAVRCLVCGHVSTTFQHFQDLLLDIRKVQTVEEGLDGYFSREQLDDESYHCEACQKKVRATKQFSLERAPMVLCIQLKRFSVTNNKISKHVQFKQRLELSKFARHRPSAPLVYRLVALVTHMGPTVSCGHYTAVAQAPCGTFYQFDDSTVRPISHQAVFTTNAYIMMYELERSPVINGKKTAAAKSTTTTVLNDNTNVAPQIGNANTKTGSNFNGNTSKKVYGPELPPKYANGAANGNTKPTASSSSSDSEGEQPAKPKNIFNGCKGNNGNGNASTATRSNGAVNGSLPSSSALSSPSPSPAKKLVPYEEDDDDSSSEEIIPDALPRKETKAKVINTRAANGEWSVTSSTDDLPSAGDLKKSANPVGELLKMSHSGYSAPVAAWNGNRSQLSKEVVNEKREDRKRALSDDSDQGRAKHVKVNAPSPGKSNPGYNPVQEAQNRQNYSNGGKNGYRPYHGGNNNNNNRHRNRFYHRNGGYYKNNRYRS